MRFDEEEAAEEQHKEHTIPSIEHVNMVYNTQLYSSFLQLRSVFYVCKNDLVMVSGLLDCKVLTHNCMVLFPCA